MRMYIKTLNAGRGEHTVRLRKLNMEQGDVPTTQHSIKVKGNEY